MTPKQTEKLKKQIVYIKRTLAAEKRKFGAYDDSRGMRYYPPKVYLKLNDFKGGLTYAKWFHKNFPDDLGYPDFLFELTVILFKTNNLKNAEKKAFETFFSNTYLFDKFLGRPIVKIDKYEYSNIDIAEFTYSFEYSSDQPEFVDFSAWLTNFITTEKFLTLSNKFILLNKILKKESVIEKRGYLLQQIRHLEDEA